MSTIRHFLRLWHISLILARYRLDEVIHAAHLFRPFTWLAPGRGKYRGASRGRRLRLALQELGPVYVKFGQILSTRRDLLPKDIATELAYLQDHVEPFPSAEARRVIEEELGSPVSEMFAEFHAEPLASASIAQVHAARLQDGEAVVVKVVRPDIEARLARDISLLKTIAGLAERYWAEGERVHPLGLVREFETVVYDELDMQREASNASMLRRNFTDSKDVYIPKIHWPYCKNRVLVMERVSGIPVKDTETLKARGYNLERLAKRGVRLFYTQVFRDNLFHADMHPGNILVAEDDPDDPSFIALDFGIVCSLTPEDLHYIGENFIAIFNQKYRRVAELHVEAGWVPRDTRIDEMEAAVRTVCEPTFTRPLNEVSFGEMLAKLFRVARRFKLNIQPQLIMLQKTLLNIEGLGRDLYPELDIWAVAKPELESIMRQRHNPAQAARTLRNRLPGLLEQAPEVPDLVYRLLKQATHGELKAEWRNPQLDRLPVILESNRKRTVRAIVGGVFLITAAVLKGQPPVWTVLEAPVLPSAALAIGAVLLLLALRR